MIRSMTGFGRGQRATEKFAIKAEIRSVNNRSLRVIFRLPDRLQGLEPEFEKIVRESITRGSVTVALSLDDLSGDPGYMLDTAAIAYYRDTLKSLSGEQVPMSVLVTLPGTVRKRNVEELPEDLGRLACEALKAAVDEMVVGREREGAFIWADMIEHCAVIEKLVLRVEGRIPSMVEEYRKRLSERLAKLLEGVGCSITDDDVRREIALFADRSDISEEITRMRSHLALMNDAGSATEAYGRKLEFVMQEMFREANTMGSKSNDPEMVHAVLDIKAEIEKLREQALNVE